MDFQPNIHENTAQAVTFSLHEIMKVNITDTGIETKGLFSTKEYPLEDITKAYMRIEEIQAKVCCGRANFDRSYLVLLCGGKEVVIEMATKAQVKHALETLQKKNPV